MNRRHVLTVLAATPAAAAETASFAKTFRDSFIAHWKDTKEYSMAVLDAMPAEGYVSKPSPVQMTFGEQMRHHAQANVAYFRSFGLVPVSAPLDAGRAELEKLVPAADKAAVQKYVEAAFDYVLLVLNKITDQDLARTDLVLRQGTPRHSGIDICLRAYTHTAHHRGQAVVYLRVQGVKPPAWKFEPHA